ncbi:MAG: hypothetical protein COV31_01920 [Candidatus Yanofskybacteria bacterium CG10_big_fil_rev_8_21_14_0_10_46_23]|uniref:DNA recombination protein RmuC n=1 Tax=Candidatus Yanofskybacteria bacterium CG10_big_fil_rev_8_21_14_0_10_46_23 TaxID=1975098 RepID=A0A2H0R465_9BACT|nr:MAG: hypothetical protein COV31_01920 [Candidatus Yanofskybacteria bacterium CG10_big_fil_rev_8_21_14_0_10_46_23]
MSIGLIIVGLVGAAALAVSILVLRALSRPKVEEEETKILNQKLDSFSTRVLEELKESRQSVQHTSLAMNKQVSSFTAGLTQLQSNLKGVHESVQESVKNVSSLQDIFRSPKLRGQWGEMSLEFALKTHFPASVFQMQRYFQSGEAVDAVLKLPNGLLLPIDSKFNLDNFEKMVQSESDEQRAQFRKTFLLDVRKKIDEIATKYILPSEGTTDLALMYIPAEAIYYELIYNTQEANIHDYALKKKVVLTSPNTLYVTLSSINHWFRDVHITEKTKEIIKGLEIVKKDATTLEDDFRKLGSHLSNTQSAFERSDKRLGLLKRRMDKVTQIEGRETIGEAVEGSLAQEELMGQD